VVKQRPDKNAHRKAEFFESRFDKRRILGQDGFEVAASVLNIAKNCNEKKIQLFYPPFSPGSQRISK
jgi:hypothetical protein